MLALPEAVVRDDRPAYRPFRVGVVRVAPLAPGFTRVTLAGPQLHLFGRDGLDQRVKLLFPLPGVGLSDVGVEDQACHRAGDWYARWQALPSETRNPMRTFTVRAVRPAQAQIDVDFAVHPASTGAPWGPAARWLAAARPGDELTVVGPDVRSLHSAQGIDFRPGDAEQVLLVGDETAVPAIGAIAEALPRAVTACALLETAGGRVPLDPRVDARWLVRDPAARGARLAGALREWLAAHRPLVAATGARAPQRLEDVDVDTDLLWESAAGGSGGLYAWLAGEAGVIKGLRRLLVSEHGLDRSRVAFMGYWRAGRAEL